MALAKKPVNGMKDILPEEMQIRDYVMNVIKETYRSFGFTPIETPCMENIANLSNKQGGENEKLIFKVLKKLVGFGWDYPAGVNSLNLTFLFWIIFFFWSRFEVS